MLRFSAIYLLTIAIIASVVLALPARSSYQPPDNGGPSTTTNSGTRVTDEPPEHRGTGR